MDLSPKNKSILPTTAKQPPSTSDVEAMVRFPGRPNRALDDRVLKTQDSVKGPHRVSFVPAVPSAL